MRIEGEMAITKGELAHCCTGGGPVLIEEVGEIFERQHVHRVA
jgi:hypothetical protein